VFALTTEQVAYGLTTVQIASFTTTQACALTTTQIEALSSSQTNAFTQTAFDKLTLGTPLILDLNGNGKLSQSITNGVQFDLFNSGNKVNTGWVASGEGLLVMDRNQDGVINNGSELFGSATLLPDGQQAANGFAALSAMDTNGDAVISSADKNWSALGVWVDSNSDGVSQPGEVKSLDSLGITQLNLNAQSTRTQDAGNIVGLVSSYVTNDGATHEMADVWFVADKASATPAAAVPATTASDAGGSPSANMGSLLQTISSYYSTQALDPNTTTVPLPQVATQSGVVANLADVMSVMQKYDANGNVMGTSSASQSVSATATLINTASLIPIVQGVLISGK